MSVYNGERYLREAVGSILNQTFADFEFIIIDDGSTDGTSAILSSYADPRIRLVHNPENIGLTRSLNKGLTLAQGAYIARMDADDISLPNRCERQIASLSASPDVGLLGVGWCNLTSNGEKQQVANPPATDSVIRWFLLFGTVLAHPGVMFRKDLIGTVGPYNETLRFAQDYELWCRMAHVTKLANLSDPLLLLRRGDPGRISENHLREQWDDNCATSARCIRSLLEGDTFTDERARKLCALIFLDRACAEWDLQAVQDLDLVLERFLARHKTGLTRVDREQIADHICALASYHTHVNVSVEEWRMFRRLLASAICRRLPLLNKRRFWRLFAQFAIGRRATEYIRRIRLARRKRDQHLVDRSAWESRAE